MVSAVTAVALLVYLGGRAPQDDVASGEAPAFTLASTAGTSVSLSDYAGRNVLLYFNEGVGCDACFYQMVELERNADRFADTGIEIVPIVVNPAPMVSEELRRFGLATPYLIDDGTTISQAYGMLGDGMHANLPGHGFVLIDAEGQIRWNREYPSMFVSADELLAALPSVT